MIIVSKALSPSDWAGMMKNIPLGTLSRQERRKAERSRKKAKKKKAR